MKKLKLSTKLTLVVLLSVVIIMVAVLAYQYLRQQARDIENANSSAVSIAMVNGSLVEKQLNEALVSARALVQTLSGFEDFPVEGRRDFANSVIKKITENNPNYLSAWASFEPNWLDGLDSQFAGTADSDATGRFISCWFHGESGVEFSVLTDYAIDGAGDYYQLAFQSGKEQILEPYAYMLDGKSVSMTSFAVPIHNAKDRLWV